MTYIPTNAFTNRSRIKNECDFIGRQCRANCQFALQKMPCIFPPISLYSFGNKKRFIASNFMN